MNMLTAAEAHKITKETNLNDLRKSLEKVTDQILIAAKKGKYSTDICINAAINPAITWNDDDNEHFIKVLADLGYNIQGVHKELTHSENNKYFYFITVGW